jgi:hypothetical protein
VPEGMRRDGSALERGTVPGCLLDDPAQTFLYSPTGEWLSKAVLKDEGQGFGRVLVQGELQLLDNGF